jgi:carboxymethylenebutenolidase
MRPGPKLVFAVLSLALATGCGVRRIDPSNDHAQHEASSAGSVTSQGVSGLPAGAAGVATRLATTPRHAEWVTIKTGPSDSVRAWVVYPQRSGKAPVVLVVHEIFGLSAWVRGVADQVAADGFIAIAPDLLTGKAPLQGDSLPSDVARAEISKLKADDVHRQLAAVAQYGMSLPAAQRRYGIVGYCWGGSTSFAHAVRSPEGLGGAVVYYGGTPAAADLPNIKVPVLGLYGGSDARITATVPKTDSLMKSLGKSYDPHVFEGAMHGFLRAQDQPANLAATQQAWPLTIAFFRKNLGA